MSANQLKKKFIGNDQVDGSKILLENDQYLRVKLQNGSTKNLLKLDATDKLILSDAPIITTPSTDANGLQTKSQLESAVAAEAALRAAADAGIQTDLDAAEAAIAQEAIDRAAADSALAQDILDEETARIAADALLIPLSQKGANNGVATLDGSGKIPSAQLPSYVDDVLEYANVAAFPGTGETGKIYVALDTLRTYRWGGSAYAEISPSAVTSVNGQTDAVVLTTSHINEGSNLYFTDARAQAANDARFDLVEADVADHETRITTLENAVPAWNKEKFVVNSTIITNGYVDLAHIVVPGSVSGSIDRLAIHEGAAEDYTISTVGGVSRITFLNDLVSPGNQSIGTGDNFYFKYQY